MLSTWASPPCEIALHLASPDVYIHPPASNSRLPGRDQALSGMVELMCPTARTVQAVQVSLQGLQTLAFPEQFSPEGVRYEEKVVMNKIVEIQQPTSDVSSSSTGSDTRKFSSLPAFSGAVTSSNESDTGSTVSGPGVEDHQSSSRPIAAPDMAQMGSVDTKKEGLHLTKGVHGFEFGFIIPSSSAAYEEHKSARLRYVVTATALDAGRGGKGNVSTWKDVYVMVHVQPDRGLTALDMQFHDLHEALGPVSIALESDSLTVGGTAAIQVTHPDPPPGLSVHAIRVIVEQTVELWSEQNQAWIKLPSEKLRVWEKGCMPYKTLSPENVTPTDTIWIAQMDDRGDPVPGRPGRGAGAGKPNLSPFGTALMGNYASFAPATSSQVPEGNQDGYMVQGILRLPDHRAIRPSTVRGSHTDVQITHELGTEIYFSRLSVLDERPHSDSFGMPKVQVFCMRRPMAIPSCACTHDTIHLPPYSAPSAVSSTPNTPLSSIGGLTSGSTTPESTAPSTPVLESSTMFTRRSTDMDRRLSSLGLNWLEPLVMTETTSVDRESPSRRRSGLAAALRLGRKVRQASPERGKQPRNTPTWLGSPLSLGASKMVKPASSQSRRPSFGNSLSVPMARASISGSSTVHRTSSSPSRSPLRSSRSMWNLLTPKDPTATEPRARSPGDLLPPAHRSRASSEAGYPLTKPPPDPVWSIPPLFYARVSNTSRSNCTCGRSTEELARAEQRLMHGGPTAPGTWLVDPLNDPDPSTWAPPPALFIDLRFQQGPGCQIQYPTKAGELLCWALPPPAYSHRDTT